MTAATALSFDEYTVLELFVEGENPAVISDRLGMRLVDVGAVINRYAGRNKSKARDVLNQVKKPESPLVAPVEAPKASKASKAKPAPKRPEIAVTITGNPDAIREGVALVASAIAVDDLETIDGVVRVAIESGDDGLHNVAQSIAADAAHLRKLVAKWVASAPQRARIAELEVELARLREEVEAA